MQRCTICRGTKKIMGMGGISKPCEPCKGIGYVEGVATIPSEPFKGAIIIDEPTPNEAFKVLPEAQAEIIEKLAKPLKIDGRKLYWEKKRAEKLAKLAL